MNSLNTDVHRFVAASRLSSRIEVYEAFRGFVDNLASEERGFVSSEGLLNHCYDIITQSEITFEKRISRSEWTAHCPIVSYKTAGKLRDDLSDLEIGKLNSETVHFMEAVVVCLQ